MAHAEHFLSRLSRVDDAQVELAMQLYRDPRLVGLALLRAPLPDGAERVALALSEGGRGPFVVVTRDGAFVTCLGEGMKHDLPVVSRERIDRALEDKLRLEIADAVEERAGSRAKMVQAAKRHWPPLSREELVANSAFEPILFGRHLDLLCVDAFNNAHALGGLTGLGLSAGELRPLVELRAGMIEAAGNVAVLTAGFGRELWEQTLERAGAPGDRTLLGDAQLRTGHLGCAMKGLWALNRMGKPMLAPLKRDYAQASTTHAVWMTALGLAILALGHAKLRAEALDALAKDPEPFSDGKFGPVLRPFLAYLRKVLASPEEFDRYFVALGRASAAEHGRARSYASPDDVPPDVARAWLVSIPVPIFKSDEGMRSLLCSLPWLARAPAEDLYLREEDRDALVPEFDPKRILDLAQRHRWFNDSHATVMRDAPRVGRNDSCPCGSGKKYKKCCAA